MRTRSCQGGTQLCALGPAPSVLRPSHTRGRSATRSALAVSKAVSGRLWVRSLSAETPHTRGRQRPLGPHHPLGLWGGRGETGQAGLHLGAVSEVSQMLVLGVSRPHAHTPRRRVPASSWARCHL